MGSASRIRLRTTRRLRAAPRIAASSSNRSIDAPIAERLTSAVDHQGRRCGARRSIASDNRQRLTLRSGRPLLMTHGSLRRRVATPLGSLSLLEDGDRQGRPPLVLIHGFGEALGVWDPMAA